MRQTLREETADNVVPLKPEPKASSNGNGSGGTSHERRVPGWVVPFEATPPRQGGEAQTRET
jgi:hypothetical protein